MEILTCSCGYDDDADWYSVIPNNFTTLKTKKYRRRCRSCKRMIEIGAVCVEFCRYRYALTNVEYAICGDAEIDLASWYHCERCGEIYLNLKAIGYCMPPEKNMDAALQEYWHLTGFVPQEKE